MSSFRRAIPDFATANPIYIGAQVFVYEVDGSGGSTGVLATLYAAPRGAQTLSNPLTLDGEGKWPRQVYIETPVTMTVVSSTVPGHSTGVVVPLGKWRGVWAAGTAYVANDYLTFGPAGEVKVYGATDVFVSSGSFDDDLAAGKLALLFDGNAILGSGDARYANKDDTATALAEKADKDSVQITPFDDLSNVLKTKVLLRTAISSDETAITTAIQAALTKAAALGGGTVKLPGGLWRTNGKLSAAIGVDIVGDGKSATILAVNANQGIEFSGSLNTAWSSVRDLTVAALKTAPNDGTGFGIKFTGVRANRQYFDLSNVDVRSYDGITRSYGFDNCIWVHDAVAAFLDRFNIDGQFQALSGNVLAGQKLQTAVLSTGTTTQLTAKSFTIASIYTGFGFTGALNEGPRISDGDMVGVYYGIEAPGYNRPGFWVNNVHINAVRRGIYVEGATDATFTDLWLYRSNVFFSDTDWQGLRLKSCLARADIKGLHTALSITTDTQYGLWLEDCQGVSASNLMISQANRAIYHSGTNLQITYNNVVTNGLGAGTAFTFTATDSEIFLGAHQFHGSVGTKYSYTPKRSIFIQGKAPRYNGATGTQTISAAATKELRVGRDQQFQHFAMATGTAPYTYNIDLDPQDALTGDFFRLYITIGSSSNPTVIIRNGLAGATLATLNVTTFKRYAIEIVRDDTSNWKIISSVESLH